MLGVGRGGTGCRAEGAVAGGGPARDRDPRDAATDAMEVPAWRIADEERDAWVVLDSVRGVGPVSFARLVAALGDVRNVLRLACAPGGPARLVAASAGHDDGTPSLSPPVARLIAEAAECPERSLEPVRRAGVRVVTLADGAYPPRLRRIELPPPVLFVRGAPEALDRLRAVAIVGTRRPTTVGRATAGRIADAVSALGATVVSGLALGIDAAAHAAAVRADRPTIAVLGGGHGHLYPAGHRGLAASIVASGGAVISEFPPDTIPTRGTFPRRNRIISGISDATVVVEAGVRSGALTTAAWALEQGRGLHIVPGRLDDPAVAGCLAFLREAGGEARIVAGVPELLEDLGLLGEPPPGHAPADVRPPRVSAEAVLAMLPLTEGVVAGALAAGHGTVDELVALTGLTGATVLGTLTALEMRGLIVEVFGRYRPAGALAGPRSATTVQARARAGAGGRPRGRAA